MGVRILRDKTEAAMYCSTSGWAFGPVFDDRGLHDADERIEAFLRWLKADPRTFTSDSALEAKYSAWLAQEDAQWAAEAAAAREQSEREERELDAEIAALDAKRAAREKAAR